MACLNQYNAAEEMVYQFQVASRGFAYFCFILHTFAYCLLDPWLCHRKSLANLIGDGRPWRRKKGLQLTASQPHRLNHLANLQQTTDTWSPVETKRSAQRNPAQIAEPENHELNSYFSFKPLSFRVVCRTAITNYSNNKNILPLMI